MSTFNDAKIGDDVWSFIRGWGKIVALDINKKYSLSVDFDNGMTQLTYTLDGYCYNSESPTLFWDKFEIPIIEKPKPKFKIIKETKIPNISFKPKEGDRFYFPSFIIRSSTIEPSYIETVFSENSNSDNLYKNENLCYPYNIEGIQAAFLHAKAMLNYKNIPNAVLLEESKMFFENLGSYKGKIFLGGTCNGSEWRKEVIPKLSPLHYTYFDPVVSEWNEEAKLRELQERKDCDILLYVITPKMKGVYSIAEVVEDSIKNPSKTVMVVLNEYDGESFDSFQINSLNEVMQLVIRNGGMAVSSLKDLYALLIFNNR